MDHDGLILITIILDNALNQYVEWLAQEDIIPGVANDVELHISCDVSNEDQHVVGEAKHLIYFSICQLHM